MVPQNNRIYVCGNKYVFSADSLSFTLPKPIEATKSCFPKKKCENTFQTRDGFAFCYIEKNSIEGLQDKIDLGQ